jgi:endogenous inhibitor of DNA gyrase (YacG/DUF329 family)
MTRKTYRRKYSRKPRKYTRKVRKNTRKVRKNTKNGKRGGNGDGKVNCCMCGKEVESKLPYSLNPAQCLQENGLKAHRICENCWFEGKNAFVKEGISHKCPGCEKRLPFTKVPEVPEVKGGIIDLTED